MTTRRRFLQTVPAATLAMTFARGANAQAARLEETDALAVLLGYKNDATKVDVKTFPAYVAGRNCAGCQLYQGKATDSTAACGAVGGKLVSARGWCVAWAKKA